MLPMKPFEISSLDDIAVLRESCDIECKLAEGQDGQGRLPKEVWKTYSAFANTAGGNIFLGLKENKNNHFELKGIINTQKVIDELWTNLQNTQKVSGNILQQHHVNIITIDGKNMVHIQVPRATRQQQPVYLNNNPLTGTYKRFNTADICQSEAVVCGMLAEQQQDSRDEAILTGYSLADLSLDSIQTFRIAICCRHIKRVTRG
jgi:predicted HTH transcriptional regulator